MEINDTKLIILLKTFSTGEIEKFENFVKSPFFNKSSQIVQFSGLLRNSYPNFTKIDKSIIYNSIYPGEEYKDKKLRDLFSRTLKLCEDFLSQIEFDKMTLTKSKLILKQYSGRNLKRHFDSKGKEAKLIMDKETEKGCYYFQERYELFRIIRKYNENFRKQGTGREFFEDYTDEIKLMTDYLTFMILEYGNVLSVENYALNYEYKFGLHDMILLYLNNNPPADEPVIDILHRIHLFYKEKEELSYYRSLKKSIDKYINNFEYWDRKIIYVLLFNITKLLTHRKIEGFKEENYILLKESLDFGLYPKENNYFIDTSYISVASNAMTEKDFDWAQEFMDKYKDKLDPAKKENTYRLCKSIMEFRKKNFDAALKGLSGLTITDFHFQNKVFNVKLKIFYETGKYESAKSLIDAYRHYLKLKRKQPEFMIVRFSNYVNFVSRLVNIHLGGDPKNVIAIKRDIQNTDTFEVESKTWLLEQANKINY